MKRPRGRTLLAALAVAHVAAAAPASFPPPADAPRAAVVFSGPALATRYTARVVMEPGDPAANDRVRAAIDRELSLASRLFSAEDGGSEISRLNAHASTSPFPVSAETLAALEVGRRASELTGGAFDVTVAPLVAAWGSRSAGAAARDAHRRGPRRALRERRLPASAARPGGPHGEQGAP